MSNQTSFSDFSFYQNYESTRIASKYNTNALLLYVLWLKWKIDDLDSVAYDSITDGSDDCKCDMIWMDDNLGIAVIAQSTLSQQFKTVASSNKASDLNTAVTWLFSMPEGDIPEKIKSHALELRKKIQDGIIKRLEFWYVHNS